MELEMGQETVFVFIRAITAVFQIFNASDGNHAIQQARAVFHEAQQIYRFGRSRTVV